MVHLTDRFLQAAYVAVMQNVTSSNRSGYESLLRVYRETDLSQEKTRILGNNVLFMEMVQNISNVQILLYDDWKSFCGCRFFAFLSRPGYYS